MNELVSKQITILEQNYNLLIKLIPDLEILSKYTILKSKPLMDLHVQLINNNKYQKRIIIAHKYKQMGKVIADPAMELFIIPKARMVEAISFKDIYAKQYGFPRRKFIPETKEEINLFLNKWLKVLIKEEYLI